MTNYEKKIQEMTIRDLAYYISLKGAPACNCCIYKYGTLECRRSVKSCVENIKQWLESEAEND